MWSFHNPTRVVFGSGAVERVRELVPPGRVLLVTTAGSTARGLTERLAELIGGAEQLCLIDDVAPNPDVSDLARQLDRVPADVGCVVAAGGGSALDSGKVLAVLVRRRMSGGAGGADPLTGGTVGPGDSVPVVAVPTTAGTGAEVTPFSTVWDFRAKKKHSVAGAGMFPVAAVLDPDLTLTLPEDVTACTGLDALSQGLEALWNRNGNPVTDAFAARAARIALESLEPLCRDLENAALRSKMMEASLLAGLAISNTRTAIAHSISYPVTAHFGVPHGFACSFTLPAILEFNGAGGGERAGRIADLVGLGGLEELHDRIRNLLQALRVGVRMGEYGFDASRIPSLGPEMITPGRADNNVRDVSVQDAVSLATRSWEALREGEGANPRKSR